MNVTFDEPFEDSNGLWTVTFRGPNDYVRMRLKTWQVFRLLVQMRLRQLFGLPLLPFHVPKDVIFETGPRLGS